MPTTTIELPALNDACREVIADLATRTSTPDTSQIVACIHARVGPRETIPAQVLTQHIAGVVSSYFRRCGPGPGWRFTGRELSLIPDQTLLTWTNDRGQVIADVVLSGEAPSTSTVLSAAQGVHHRAQAVHGHDLVLVRALVPRSPASSMLLVA